MKVLRDGLVYDISTSKLLAEGVYLLPRYEMSPLWVRERIYRTPNGRLFKTEAEKNYFWDGFLWFRTKWGSERFLRTVSQEELQAWCFAFNIPFETVGAPVPIAA